MSGRRGALALVAAAGLVTWVVGAVVADDQEHHRHRNRHREGGRKQLEAAVPAAEDPTYLETCGACHFPLQPALLPARSWQRLLAGSQDHFGQSLDLEVGRLAELEAYLTAHAAERASGELARAILESLGSSTPLRVTDVPEIRSAHSRLEPSVFERPSVAGRADCPACHRGAHAGSYEDGSVRVPGS
jgi:hypothetical protein